MASIRMLWASPFTQISSRRIPFLISAQPRSSDLFLRFLPHPLHQLPKASVSSLFVFRIPSILSGLWESILRAVPKKKTSHMKKRHRQMAGKALKDVKNVTNCPGCGQPKRAHLLCPTCVSEIKQGWRENESITMSERGSAS